jgi:error-prone DNA polymerase
MVHPWFFCVKERQMSYTELQVTTNFTFLRGASHPGELVEQAADYGYSKIAITDRNSFAGLVRAHVATKGRKIKIIPACRLDLLDGPSLLAYPTDKDAYSRLSALLTRGNLRAEKGECHLYKADVYEHAEGLKFISIPPDSLNEYFDLDESYKAILKEYREAFGKELYLAATRYFSGNDQKRLYRLSQLSKKLDMSMVASNDVHYHEPGRRQLQDILTCIREKCTIHNAGFKLHPNAERYLKPEKEMERIFENYPEAIWRTQEIAEACQFSLSSLQYVYPEELTTDGRTPQEELTMLTWKGAKERFGNDIPEKITKSINEELAFMERKGYASYFLTVYDYVHFARSRDILCQGRGSAANSVVCYCLGITSVNPSKINLLFARFMSDARDEPPDIDVDFEHERREEVIQYIYNKYGRDRAGIIATVTQERQKGAIRDVGKAMGLSVDTIKRLSGAIWEFTDEWFEGKLLADQGLNPNDAHLKKALELTGQLMGFPRQLGQHTGGFVITQGKVSELCPVINARMADRTNVEWNKDDIEALGFFKVDVLGLGMLTCIRRGFDLIKEHYGKSYTLASVPQDDPKVYDMFCEADTLGVFQIESRAQMSMLPRLKPKEFYDLVIEVAIVRPGPIQGDMVHPYLRRRNNLEAEEYPKEELRGVLGRTKGVPLFQEQAMEVAIVAARFTPTEADELRRSMATFKANGKLHLLEKKLVDGMVANGYEPDFSRRIFKQLQGFEGYGFPESHAASFALLVYVSGYIKYHYPDVFACALLNSQPMGFYQPAQIVIDAQKHGVKVRPVDVNYSGWDNALEEQDGKYRALRLGFRQVKGLTKEEMQLLITQRASSYASVQQLSDVGLSQIAIEKLSDADALRSMDLDRRQALWQASALTDKPIGLFKGRPSESMWEPQIKLPLMTDAEHVVQDYASTGLSLKKHPVSFVREQLRMLHVVSVKDLDDIPDGAQLKIAGMITVRQRPGTAKGICFITIEDETGFAKLVAFQGIFDQYRKEILQSTLLMVEGKLQREEKVVHVVIKRCFNLTSLMHGMSKDKYQPVLSRSDETSIPTEIQRQKQPREVFYKGRNFK